MTKQKGLVSAILIALGLVMVFGVAYLIQSGNFNDQSRASTGSVMVGKLIRESDPACTKCIEQCPGKDNVLRNCHPMESDGTSQESLCNQAGRMEYCGAKTYCCPKAGALWTTDIGKCVSVAKITDPKRKTAQTGGKFLPSPSKPPLPPKIPAPYRLLKDGGVCTALVVSKTLAEPLVGKKVVALGSLKEPYFYVSTLSEYKCTEQCPGKDGVLRSCTPPESDGTSNDSLCNQNGRIESCGGVKYCCMNGVWKSGVSNCISATSTPTMTPTPTPRPPTPTASPSANVSPVIIETELPTAFKGTYYSASIAATDQNSTNALNMTIEKLPPGLSSGPCAAPTSGGSITCYFSGTPSLVGSYQIVATAKDNFGGIDIAYFQLSVK